MNGPYSNLVLGADYELMVYSREFFNTVMYNGTQFSEKQIYLYLADSHFSVITSMPAFLQRAYFCKCCKVGYQDAGTHMCEDSYMCCSNTTKCGFEKWVSCTSCHQHFVSITCYQHHLATDTCRLVHCCDECG